MQKVSKSTFNSVVYWLKLASNYRGSASNEIDCETHYMQVNGEDKLAAWKFYDGLVNDTEMYEVDKTVLRLSYDNRNFLQPFKVEF